MDGFVSFMKCYGFFGRLVLISLTKQLSGA